MADFRTIGPRRKSNKKKESEFPTCPQCAIKQIVELYNSKYLNDRDGLSKQLVRSIEERVPFCKHIY